MASARPILIGSRAIKHYFPDFPREPKDWDYIGEGKNIPGVEEYHYNPVFENYTDDVMEPDDIYTLKISHAFWDIKWEKHVFDIVFLTEKGCKLKKELFDDLYSYWCHAVHGDPNRSDLTLSKNEFFNNALKKYDHDYLHTLLKKEPTYLKVLKDGSEVEPCEKKFNLLSYEDKMDLVREEVYVMAYERLGGRDYRVAYSWMLKKFVLHHAPVWEAIFILQNFKQLHKPFFNYKTHLDYELSRNH